MQPVYGARTRPFSRRGACQAREQAARRRYPGGTVAVRALILGGARSGKSDLAERLASSLGGERVLYVATARLGEDEDLARRVRLHRERRPGGWGTLEIGNLDEVLEAAASWDAVLFDSLTLWVSAREERWALAEFDAFLRGARDLPVPFVLVSDEVGLGVIPESPSGRRFRDSLGLVNQRAAAAAEEVHLCVAGVSVRIK